MRNIILILLLFTLVSSNKFLEREALPEELDDEIILQKGGFRSPSIKNGPRIPVNLAIKLGPANSGIKVKPGIKAKPKNPLDQQYPIKKKPVNFHIKVKPVRKVTPVIKIKQALVPKKPTLPLKNNLNGKFPVLNTRTKKLAKVDGKVQGEVRDKVPVVKKGGAGSNVKEGKVITHKQSNLRGTGLSNIFKGNNNKKDNKLVNNRRKQNNQIILKGHQQNHINNGGVKGGWKEIGGGFSGSDGGNFKVGVKGGWKEIGRGFSGSDGGKFRRGVKGGWKEIRGGFKGSYGGSFKVGVKGNVKRNLGGGFTGTGGGNFKVGAKGNVKIHQQNTKKGSYTKGSSRDSRRGSKSSKK